MDAPPIQYARTEDGVNIAYAVSGEGVPILRTPGFPFNDVAKEWEIERGQGLSDRDVDEFVGKDCRFSAHGTHDLKGFEEPARLFGVAWRVSAP